MELGVRIKKKWGAKIFIFNKVRVQKPQSPKNSAKRNRRYSGFWTLPSFISLCLCFLLVQEVFQQLLKLVLANFVISGVCYCIPSLGRIWPLACCYLLLLAQSTLSTFFGQVSWVAGVILWYQSSLGCFVFLLTFQTSKSSHGASWSATPKHCTAGPSAGLYSPRINLNGDNKNKLDPRSWLTIPKHGTAPAAGPEKNLVSARLIILSQWLLCYSQKPDKISKFNLDQVCKTLDGLYGPRRNLNGETLKKTGHLFAGKQHCIFLQCIILTRMCDKKLWCCCRKRTMEGFHSLGVEPFVMSWQEASSGVTWGQGGVPLVCTLVS